MAHIPATICEQRNTGPSSRLDTTRGYVRRKFISPVGCAQAPKIRRRYFYRHERAPEHEFAYPVPLYDNKDQLFVSTAFPLISCRTRRAWLYAGERLDGSAPTVSLRTTERLWAGVLQLHEDLLDARAEIIEGRKASEQPFELAEIARNHVPEMDLYREDQLIERTHDEQPKRGSRYEFYDVLWLEWRDEIACRKGLGRVEREMWEAQEREWFDLILG